MDMQTIGSEKIGRSTPVNFSAGKLLEPVQALNVLNSKRSAEERNYVLLIDPRALDRECLSRGLSICDPSMNIVTVNSVEDWRSLRMKTDPSAILVVIGGKKIAETEVREYITGLASRFKESPVIVVAESDELTQILAALECGARGYIPSNVGIEIAAEVIALAQVGGVFVPASSVIAVGDLIRSAKSSAHLPDSLFTPREAEVVEALRRGKANKIIAYEMNLCESTVKVHVRNIMKKLNATNRTEVAFKFREIAK